MKKLEDIVLKKGDIVEFTSGYITSINGSEGDTADKFYGAIKSIKRPVKFETIYEAPQPILDKEEKEYLENVIRPFKDKIQYIVKRNSLTAHEWIHIDLEKNEIIALPYFKQNSMYKGMKVWRKYTLKELGLFE